LFDARPHYKRNDKKASTVTCERQSSYSPDPNPDEYLNYDLKNELTKNPKRVSSYFIVTYNFFLA